MTTSTALNPMSSIDVARIFLAVGGEMSFRKLQRIICLAHENHIRETDKPLIQGDTIEAREQGPVFANLYRLIGARTEEGSFPRVCPTERLSSMKTSENTPHRSARCSRAFRESVCPAWRVAGDRLGEWRGKAFAGFFDWLLDSPSPEKPMISNSMIRHFFRAM